MLYHQANLGAANSATSTQNDPSILDPTKTVIQYEMLPIKRVYNLKMCEDIDQKFYDTM